MSTIVRMSYIDADSEKRLKQQVIRIGLLQLKGVAAMEVHIAALPNLGGLIIGQDPLPSFQRQETSRSRDNPRLNGKIGSSVRAWRTPALQT